MIVALLLATLRLSTPLIFAALGGVVSERAGVIALGLEAMMLAGAFVSVAVASVLGGVAGLLAGAAAGLLVGLLHAAATQVWRVPGVLSGVALNLGLAGLTTFAVRLRPEGWATTATVPDLLLTVVALAATVSVRVVLFHTALGLRLRSCGENPQAAEAAGLSVARLRWGACAVSGLLAGLGGVSLALTGLGAFTENMTAGRGYIALAAVIFGRWNPPVVALAAVIFGFGDALQLSLQTAGFAALVPTDLLALLPYLLTLAVLVLRSGSSDAPAAL
ncbi:MAG: ABC transporter permease [Capsulimonadales bacterium]|nr:ABC transporter permease [Capsulimonadales bacterium]